MTASRARRRIVLSGVPNARSAISGHPIYQDIHGTALDTFRMHYFNQTIEHVAYECLFARLERLLKAIAPLFCSKPPSLRWVTSGCVQENRSGKLGPKPGPNDIFGWDQVRHFRREAVKIPCKSMVGATGLFGPRTGLTPSGPPYGR
jgi:hypothetical protein